MAKQGSVVLPVGASKRTRRRTHSTIMENPKLSLTLSVLDSYFHRTTTLLTYLFDILQLVEEPLEGVSGHLLRSLDSPAFGALVNTTYVSTADTAPCKFKVYEPMMNMCEVGISLYSV